MSDLRAELVDAVDEAEWNWLMPHAKKDTVIVVEAILELADVGVAIANDNVSLVQGWIEAELIHKPSPTQISDWNQAQSKRFSALIVQPYVLVQEMG